MANLTTAPVDDSSQAKAMRLRIVDALFLLPILVAFSVIAKQNYWLLPFKPDDLWYSMQVASPEASLKLFFRFFNYYFAKLLTTLSENQLASLSWVSLFYTLGVISFSYAIAHRIAGRTSALIAAALVATYPTLMIQATWFGSDLPCLFFGLGAVWFALPGKHFINTMFAGLFLVGAVFSKQTGICFVLPVMMLIYQRLSLRVTLSFLMGLIGGFVFLAICDHLWLNDALYHILPQNYLSFLTRFDTQLSSDMVSHGAGTTWTQTLIRSFLGNQPGNIHYLAYLIVCVVLLNGAVSEAERSKRRLIFPVLFVGVISISLHEFVHIGYTSLALHPRYTLTMIIPVLIAFSSLIPVGNQDGSAKRRLASGLVLNALICLAFIGLLVLTQREINFYQHLRKEWLLTNSIIYVISFWILLLAIAIVSYRTSRESRGKLSYTAQSVALIIIVSYAAIWGNIEAENRFGDKFSKTAANLRRFAKEFAKIDRDTLIISLGNERKKRNLFEYLYLTNSISRERYLEIAEAEFKEDTTPVGPLSAVSEKGNKFLLTGYKPKQIEALALERGLQTKTIWQSNSLYYYQISE